MFVNIFGYNIGEFDADQAILDTLLGLRPVIDWLEMKSGQAKVHGWVINIIKKVNFLQRKPWYNFRNGFICLIYASSCR